MKKHLSLLSTAVMLALSTSASAVVITDSEGDQKVTGDQEYSQVFAIKGGTLTFTVHINYKILRHLSPKMEEQLISEPKNLNSEQYL